MKPLRPRYKRIEREVESLLVKHDVADPPVPVEEIARGLGAEVVYQNFKGEISGLLLKRPGSLVIGVDSKQTEARQRFTIAHEIGHLVMHAASSEEVHVDKHFNVHLRSPASSTAEDVIEIEANAFAAGLLMPRNMVRSDAEGHMLDFEDPRLVKQLAEKYQVSTQAITFRLINLSGNRALAYH